MNSWANLNNEKQKNLNENLKKCIIDVINIRNEEIKAEKKAKNKFKDLKRNYPRFKSKTELDILENYAYKDLRQLKDKNKKNKHEIYNKYMIIMQDLSPDNDNKIKDQRFNEAINNLQDNNNNINILKNKKGKILRAKFEKHINLFPEIRKKIIESNERKKINNNTKNIQRRENTKIEKLEDNKYIATRGMKFRPIRSRPSKGLNIIDPETKKKIAGGAKSKKKVVKKKPTTKIKKVAKRKPTTKRKKVAKRKPTTKRKKVVKKKKVVKRKPTTKRRKTKKKSKSLFSFLGF